MLGIVKLLIFIIVMGNSERYECVDTIKTTLSIVQVLQV